MPDPSYISKGVIASLAMVSGGTCYWPAPRCTVPVTVNINGDIVLNVETAHIRDARKNTHRYVEKMPPEERRQFGNLILLCAPHHRIIDAVRPDDYSIETLEEWKRQREGKNYDVLKSLPGIDEDELQRRLTEALKAQTEELKGQVTRFETAIAKLGAIDNEAAELIEQRMKAAEMLHSAARSLIHLEDTGYILRDVSRSLRGAQDTAELLIAASSELKRLHGAANGLIDAAGILQPIMSRVPMLADAHDDLVAIDHRLAQRIRELRDLRDDW